MGQEYNEKVFLIHIPSNLVVQSMCCVFFVHTPPLTPRTHPLVLGTSPELAWMITKEMEIRDIKWVWDCFQQQVINWNRRMGFGLGFGILFSNECTVIDLSHTTLAGYCLRQVMRVFISLFCNLENFTNFSLNKKISSIYARVFFLNP